MPLRLESVGALTDLLRFPQSIQAHSGTVPQVGQDGFLPDPFQLLIILPFGAAFYGRTANHELTFQRNLLFPLQGSLLYPEERVPLTY